jgi:hypothetical protein
MSLDGSSPDRGKTPNFYLLKVMHKKLAFPDLKRGGGRPGHIVPPERSLPKPTPFSSHSGPRGLVVVVSEPIQIARWLPLV